MDTYCGGTMFKRPSGARYLPVRGQMQTQSGGKRKLPSDNCSSMQQKNYCGHSTSKKKLTDKILPQKLQDLVPESRAYLDLLGFEEKLDATIMRKRLHIQESLKRPIRQKRKLRIFITTTFYPAKDSCPDGTEGLIANWELKVEGRLLNHAKNNSNKVEKKFSSFLKSLVIRLDRKLYGPDNDLFKWYRTFTTQETDSFQVKRPGDKNVRCTILMDIKPSQFRLDPRLAMLLQVGMQTRQGIISALWQYIQTHKLQDSQDPKYIICDKYLEKIFNCSKMEIAEIPQRLIPLLHPSDPIVINHIISVEAAATTKQTTFYDIDVEVDDELLKTHMNNYLSCTAHPREIQALDLKIHETVDKIHHLETNREFFSTFARDCQKFIPKWIVSQSRDLKTMTDVLGNREEERRSDFFHQSWAEKAVSIYFCTRVQEKRAGMEQALAIPTKLTNPIK